MPRARPRPRQALHAVGPHRLAVTGASYGLAATTTAAVAGVCSSAGGASTSSEPLPETLSLSVPSVAVNSESTLLQAVADSQCQIHELLSLLQVCACLKVSQSLSPPLPPMHSFLQLDVHHAWRKPLPVPAPCLRRSARRALHLSSVLSTCPGAWSALRRPCRATEQ